VLKDWQRDAIREEIGSVLLNTHRDIVAEEVINKFSEE